MFTAHCLMVIIILVYACVHRVLKLRVRGMHVSIVYWSSECDECMSPSCTEAQRARKLIDVVNVPSIYVLCAPTASIVSKIYGPSMHVYWITAGYNNRLLHHTAYCIAYYLARIAMCFPFKGDTKSINQSKGATLPKHNATTSAMNTQTCSSNSICSCIDRINISCKYVKETVWCAKANSVCKLFDTWETER